MANRIRISMRPQYILVALAAVVIAYLTLIPLAMLLYGSVKSGPPGVPGELTVRNYLALLQNWRLAGALWNSVIFSMGSSFLAFTGGLYLAWMTERTNLPWRGAVYTCVLIPMIVPGILTTVGWIILFGRRSGIINIVAMQYLGFSEPLEINNMLGMIWVQGTDQIPLAFLLLAAALRSMDPSLEEAAMVAGSSIFRTTMRITLRVLLPAILAVWMISFVRAIENFEVPALIGIPAGILVFATEVYLATKSVPTDFGLASTFAVVYLLITTFGVLLYLKWTAASEQFATITGKGFRGTSNIAYAGTKGSVIAMTRIGASQLARYDINVNAICPGATRTDLFQQIMGELMERQAISEEDARKRLDVSIPLRRSNEPEDIANLAVWLASDEARNVTGQSWNVDGGLVWD
jgi:iron(III) transport system permease protein